MSTLHDLIREQDKAADRLAEAARAAHRWLADDCQPDASWVAQGHNWNMSDADRERGGALITSIREALAAYDAARKATQ